MREVPRETRVKREKLVWRDKKETWAPKEIVVFLGLLVNRVLKVPKVQRGQRVQLVNLDQLDHQEKRVKMDHLVLLGTLEVLVKRETKELRAEMVHLV